MFSYNASSESSIQQPHEQAAPLKACKVNDDDQSNREVSSSA